MFLEVRRNMVMPLARAAVATGCDGLFLEVHENPEKALSDAATMLSIEALPNLIDQVLRYTEWLQQILKNIPPSLNPGLSKSILNVPYVGAEDFQPYFLYGLWTFGQPRGTVLTPCVRGSG